MCFRKVELAVAKDSVVASSSFKREQIRYTLGNWSTAGKHSIVPDRPNISQNGLGRSISLLSSLATFECCDCFSALPCERAKTSAKRTSLQRELH
jgi:hypothetical protein